MNKNLEVLITVILLFSLAEFGYSQLTGLDIMLKVDEQQNVDSQYGKTKMTLINKKGKKRVRDVVRYEKYYHGEKGIDTKTIVFFEYPPDIRGTGLLLWSYKDIKKDDDRWLYLPALKKIKRIAGESKNEYFMGTDFTYDDMGGRDVNEDKHILIGEEEIDGVKCYKIESIPIDKDNMYSKKIPGMEYVLSTGVFTFGIFGALTVSNTISLLAILISLLGFMQWLFSVGISANLKDVEYDSKMKIKTSPILFGVKVVNKELIRSPLFKMYSYGIKIIHIVIASLPFLLLFTSITVFNFPIPLVCFFIISIVMIYTTYKILSIPLKMRDSMLRYEGVHEGFALLLIPIVLMSYLIKNIDLFPTLILILLIIIWPLFSLRILIPRTK